MNEQQFDRGPTGTDRPDAELAAAYEAGQAIAAEALFERYYERLRQLVARQMGWKLKAVEAPSDIVQSALSSLFRRMKDGQVTVDAHGTLWPYLTTLALNKIRNRVKHWQRDRRHIDRASPLSAGGDPLDSGPTPEEVAIAKEQLELVLRPFSERRRRIVAFILQGYTPGEIAKEVGSSVRTIYNTRRAAGDVLDGYLREEI